MEQNNDSSTPSGDTGAEGTTPADTSGADNAGAQSQTEGTDQGSSTEGAIVAPAYVPNFKVKAYDKEYEIPEQFRGLIKDAETEKTVRSIFEKAYAVDEMKPKYQKLRTDYDTYKKDADPILTGVNNLTQMLNRNDFDNFFKAVGIKKEDLYKYVSNQLSLSEMTPEQQAEHANNVAMKHQNLLLEQQYQRTQEMYENMSVQTRTFELNSVLDRPEVKSVQTAFDEKLGDGAFRKAAIEHGFNVWKTQGVDLSAEQAVQDFAKQYAPFLQQQPQAPAAQTTMSSNGKPVIPNLGSRSASPVKIVPKSIADLKKLAQQAQQE